MNQLNAAAVLRAMNSPDGRKLLEILKKDQSALNKASVAAQNGDYDLVKSILTPLLEKEGGEDLAMRIQSNLG